MTEILQIRWRCDYEPCGVMSPVIQEAEGRDTIEFGLPTLPVSWVAAEAEDGSYRDFCCEAHRQLWEKEQEGKD